MEIGRIFKPIYMVWAESVDLITFLPQSAHRKTTETLWIVWTPGAELFYEIT